MNPSNPPRRVRARVYILFLKSDSVSECPRNINGLDRSNTAGVADGDAARAASPEVYDGNDFLVVSSGGIDDDV